MFKFKLGHKQLEDNEARRRLQKELFGLNKVCIQFCILYFLTYLNYLYFKVCVRGFPSRPSTLAYDSQLKLIAIGTHAGEIRM